MFEYIHKKFCFVHTNTFCKYRKKPRASPRVHLVPQRANLETEMDIKDVKSFGGGGRWRKESPQGEVMEPSDRS